MQCWLMMIIPFLLDEFMIPNQVGYSPFLPCRSRVRVDLSNKHEIMRIERTITTKHDKYRQCVVEKPMSLPLPPGLE